jgi:hypothetical protein
LPIFLFFCVHFVKEEIGLILIVYKGASLIGGNCTKHPKKNIMFYPPKGSSGKDFNLCNLRYIFINIMQPIINISSIIK